MQLEHPAEQGETSVGSLAEELQEIEELRGKHAVQMRRLGRLAQEMAEVVREREEVGREVEELGSQLAEEGRGTMQSGEGEEEELIGDMERRKQANAAIVG
jgi:K+/H+ antiporter YhaU regulatory subunit KhtT